ncbi:MAG: lysylphosphatidylglycerol synthase transmembrane domain-containing protein [Verrucomicrobia bacterium]|nr:lysylphosphatidylglycerol synthase transmembrane domain-containing protein [Verrucomicrobiota bacterium]
MLVTVVVLFLVFHDPAKRAEMGHVLLQANRWWLFAGFAAYGLVELASGIRWQLLLRVQGVALSWSRVFMLLLIGVFFNFIIPGGTGGDVVKVFYLLKETPDKRSPALLSVLVDRLIGLFSIIVMAGVLIGFRWSWLVQSPDALKYIWSALTILGVSLCGLIISFLLTGFGLIHKLPRGLPGRDQLAEMALAYNLYGRAWKSTTAAFFLSLIVNLGYFAMFFCAASAFSAASPIPSFGDFCAIMPIINTITALPISVGGLGVREKLFQVFLGDLCHVKDSVAALMSSTGYALNLIWGMIGGVLYLFYRPSEHARMAEMRGVVAHLEHDIAEEEVAIETSTQNKI